MTHDEVREAAFWHLAICADCSTTREAEAEFGERELPCGECGSPRVWAASDILELLARMELDDVAQTAF